MLIELLSKKGGWFTLIYFQSKMAKIGFVAVVSDDCWQLEKFAEDGRLARKAEIEMGLWKSAACLDNQKWMVTSSGLKWTDWKMVVG